MTGVQTCALPISSAQGYSWSNEVLNKQQFEDGLRQDEPELSDEYISLLINCLEHLRPDMVIHRITGDGPKDLLIAPLWASRKREVLNMLHHRMKEEQSYQGRLFSH